jgi:hypothetical protein
MRMAMGGVRKIFGDFAGVWKSANGKGRVKIICYGFAGNLKSENGKGRVKGIVVFWDVCKDWFLKELKKLDYMKLFGEKMHANVGLFMVFRWFFSEFSKQKFYILFRQRISCSF